MENINDILIDSVKKLRDTFPGTRVYLSMDYHLHNDGEIVKEYYLCVEACSYTDFFKDLESLLHGIDLLVSKHDEEYSSFQYAHRN